jgi:hypothetical protein
MASNLRWSRKKGALKEKGTVRAAASAEKPESIQIAPDSGFNPMLLERRS